VPSRVQQHVRERAPHFPRRAQDVQVVAVREHPAPSREDAVCRARDARRDRLHAAGKVYLACGFDDEVNVIRLNRVVRDAEPTTFTRSPQAAFQRTHVPHASQRRQSESHLQRHMAGKPRRERSAHPMRCAGSGIAATLLHLRALIRAMFYRA
jgi:hypothetical protein